MAEARIRMSQTRTPNTRNNNVIVPHITKDVRRG
jgi:hypothetical protein